MAQVKIIEVLDWKVKLDKNTGKLATVPVLWILTEKETYRKITCTPVEGEVYAFKVGKKNYQIDMRLKLIQEVA